MANGSHRRPPVPLIVVLALAIAGGAYWWWTTRASNGAGGELTFSGTVESTEYTVASAMSGRITELLVAEGDTVKKGDVVARLDSRALSLQVDQALQGVIAAKAQVRQAEDDGTDAEVTAAKARQKQAEAAVRIAKVQLGYATIVAPHDGVVVAVPANVGENAGPGKAVATLADPGDLFVRVYVTEPGLGDVKMGQQAKVTAAERTYEGTVAFIASQAEFTPNTVETKEQRGNLVYEVRVRVTDGSGALKAGLPVDVEFAQ